MISDEMKKLIDVITGEKYKKYNSKGCFYVCNIII
jgi:hypothetical protein